MGSFLLAMITVGNIPLGKMHNWEKSYWDKSIGKCPIGKSHIGKGPDPMTSVLPNVREQTKCITAA